MVLFNHSIISTPCPLSCNVMRSRIVVCFVKLTVLI